MPAAFDSVAAGYDHDFTDSLTGRAQRERVYTHLQQLLAPQSRILELNCGTGADAIWLAQQAHQVVATDIAPQMVAQTAAKVTAAGLTKSVQTAVLAAEDLADWSVHNQSFEVVFSNFAGLNCVSPANWPHLAEALAQCTTAHGQVILVLLGRFCWWETCYFLSKGQWSKAWRRRQKDAISAPLGGGVFVDTWYYSPQEILNFCRPYFSTHEVYPIGIALPPSYLDSWMRRSSRLYRTLCSLENHLGDWSVGAQFADHYLMVLKK